MCEGYNPPIEGILENFPDVLFTNCIKRGKSILKIEIGGPRLVYVFNKLNLIPSLDIIRRDCQLTNDKEIYFSYSKTLEQIIETRLSQIIKDDNQLHLYRYVYFFVLFNVIILF